MATPPFTTNIPASPLDVDVLNCQYSSRKGGWEELFDYGRLRYHLRLDPSKDGKGVQDELLAPLSPEERDQLIRLLARVLAHHASP